MVRAWNPFPAPRPAKPTVGKRHFGKAINSNCMAGINDRAELELAPAAITLTIRLGVNDPDHIGGK